MRIRSRPPKRKQIERKKGGLDQVEPLVMGKKKPGIDLFDEARH